MSRRIVPIITATFFIGSCFNLAFGQDDLRIWKEFVDALRSGKITVDNIRPYEQLGDKFKPILLGFLDSIRTQALPADWETEPEIIRTDNRIQYLIPLTSRTQKVTYCFSVVSEGSRWYFQHLEAIFIRLDKLAKLPTSEFPDVSEAQKNWAREEIYWSFVIINFYLPTVKEKGKQYALDMLKDGGGYFVGARSWVPFAPPQKAFILYLCWEQANLRGNEVTLVKLKDDAAIVRLNTHFFALYFSAAHLKPRISFDDYRQIFETIWHDRAKNAGWNMEIQYAENFEVTFHFRK